MLTKTKQKKNCDSLTKTNTSRAMQHDIFTH